VRRGVLLRKKNNTRETGSPNSTMTHSSTRIRRARQQEHHPKQQQQPDHQPSPRRRHQEGCAGGGGGSSSSSSSSSSFAEPLKALLGDINILVVTDIHGWIAGQHARHEPNLNVDFGDLLSLYQKLSSSCDNDGDWFLLFNGDFMDGTGLSQIPPFELTTILQQMPFSALNIGNHELYHNEVVDYLQQPGGFVDSWQGRFLASNVNYLVQDEKNRGEPQPQQRPFASRYMFLKGSMRNTTLLTFGFLYNMDNHCNHTRVQVVEETLQEEWFINVLTTTNNNTNRNHNNGSSNHHHHNYDAILVLAHMDAVDPLVYKIWDAIRALVGLSMPIQFITGHSHRRHYEYLNNDPLSTTLEAGRYMDTIGFVSLTLPTTTTRQRRQEQRRRRRRQQDPSSSNTTTDTTPAIFQHAFWETNHDFLQQNVWRDGGRGGVVSDTSSVVEDGNSSDDDDGSTKEGRALTRQMQDLQQRLGVLEVVTACAPPSSFALDKSIDDMTSLWWLYINQVIPKTLFPLLRLLDQQQDRQDDMVDDTNNNKNDVRPIFLQGTGALRYSLFGPVVVVDDIIAVSPFENPLYQVGSRLTASQLEHVLQELQVDDITPPWILPKFGVAGRRPTHATTTTTTTSTPSVGVAVPPPPPPQEKEQENYYYDLYTPLFHLQQVYDVLHSVLLWNVTTEQEPYFVPRPLFEPFQNHDDNHYKPLGTTKLWFDFVREEWKCPPPAVGTNDTHQNWNTLQSYANDNNAAFRKNQFLVQSSSWSLSSPREQQQQQQHYVLSFPLIHVQAAVLFLLLLTLLGWTQRKKTNRVVQQLGDFSLDGTVKLELGTISSEDTPLLQ
jgi:hypothetical protein